jgi:hypothetical protein
MSFILASLFDKFPLFFADACPSHSFFLLPNWWEYLQRSADSVSGQCIVAFNFPGDIWLVGLAVLDILLRLAGIVAVVSIIVSGAQLVLSEGSPEKATSARNRLINSLIGLAIAAGATGLVTFIGKDIGRGSGAIPTTQATSDALQHILNIGFIIIGALAFFVIVLAGFRYVISRGDPSKIADARRQILYGALGLIVAALASAIVNFVLRGLS